MTTTGPMTRRQILTVVGGLMVGLLLSALDGTIVSTALPTIAGKLGGLEHIAWIATAYLLTSTAATPLFGKISDLYGRKRLFQVAICIFLVGSLLAGIAQSFTQLVIFRGIQGIGGGGLQSMAFVMVGDLVSPRERGRYIGFFTGVYALSSVVGPLIGGFFVDHLSWRWIFTINLPIGLAALFITSRALKMVHVKRDHTIDWLGAALLVTATTSLILTATWGGKQYPWSSPIILTLAAGGFALAAAFVWWEKRAPEPILPMHLFSNRVFASTMIVMLLVGSLLMSADSFLPLFMQTVIGASATRSGLLLMPLMAGLLITSITTGRLVANTGRYKIYPVVGLGFCCVAVLAFTQLSTTTGRLYISAVQVIMGLGIGATMPTTSVAVQNSVEPKDLGVATAAAQFCRSFGGALGLAGYGAVFASRITGKISPDVARRVEDPATIRSLPPEVKQQVVHVLADGVRMVYVFALPVMLLAWVVMWFTKELPLRQMSAASLRAESEGDESAGPVAAIAH